MRTTVCRAASELVERAPFTEVTVERISTGAGVSRSSFYLHFRDKYEVLRAMTEDVADALYREAERWWEGEGPPERLVREALEGVVSIYAQNARLLAVVAEVSTYDEAFRDYWGGIVRRFVSATAEHLRRERDSGRIRAVDPDATADVLVWMTERCLYVHLAERGWTERQAVEPLLDVWLSTIYAVGR